MLGEPVVSEPMIVDRREPRNLCLWLNFKRQSRSVLHTPFTSYTHTEFSFCNQIRSHCRDIPDAFLIKPTRKSSFLKKTTLARIF